MSYITDNLNIDENIEYKGVSSKTANSFFIVLSMVLISILPIGYKFWLSDAEKKLSSYTSQGLMISLIMMAIPAFIGVLMLIFLFLKIKYTEAVITNKRTLLRTGVLSRNIIEIPHSRLQSIQVRQPLLGRIFNYGDVYLAGSNLSLRTKIEGIKNPENFRLELNRAFTESEEY